MKISYFRNRTNPSISPQSILHQATCINSNRCEQKLTLTIFQVDLAGSENVGRSGAVEKRLREAGMNSKYNLQ